MRGVTKNHCLLTVDVEDYFHVEALSGVVRREAWPDYESRVERNTDLILSLFDEFSVKGTFFILGWVAENCPALVRRIQSRGHELACHSFWHRPVYRLSQDQFREDTRRAKSLIEQIAGVEVVGYRAPTFSIVRDSLWALDILAEEGFRYDASIYPIHHDLYGIPDWDRRPQWVATKAGPILEVPSSTVRLFGMNLPCGGGGYLRLLPMAFHRRALKRIGAQPGFRGVVYVHPWEFDPEQPRLPVPALSRFRHYSGLRHTESRVRRLLAEFPMEPVAALLAKEQPSC